MNLIHRQTSAVLFTIIAFTILLVSIYQARHLLVAFVLAILFAYLLNPIVGRMQLVLRCSRGKGVLATYLLLIIGIAGICVTVGPRAFKEGVTLGKELPTLMENVGSGQIAQQYGTRHSWDIKTRIAVQQFLVNHREAITQNTQDAVNRVAGFASNLTWLILIPVLAAFLLKDHAHLTERFLQLIQTHQEQKFFRSLLKDLDAMLARFIRAQLTFASLGLVAYTAFLAIAGFPYAFAVGAIAGLLEFIPFAGPMISFALIMAVAVLMGYPHWLIVLVFLIVWRGIQDYVTSPYLMGRGMKIHPLAVICGVLTGGEIGGVMGMFLAVPVLAGARVLWLAFRQRKEEKERSHESPAKFPVWRKNAAATPGES